MMLRKVISLRNSFNNLEDLLREYYPLKSKEFILEKIEQHLGEKRTWSNVNTYASRRNMVRRVRQKGTKVIPMFKWDKEKDKKLMSLWTTGIAKEEITILFINLFDFPVTEENKDYCWKALKDRHCALNKLKPKTDKTKFRNWGKDGIGKALTPVEENLLKFFYESATTDDLQIIFWERELQRIYELASERGLRRPAKWSNKQIKLLQEFYFTKGAAYLAPLVDKNENAIRAYASLHGEKRNPSTIKRPESLTYTEKKNLKTLYTSAPFYTLYFNFPTKSFSAIHYHAVKTCKLPRRTIDKPDLHISNNDRLALVRANRQLTKLTGNRYTRLSYTEILKQFSEQETSQIRIAYNLFFDLYFTQIHKFAKAFTSTRETADHQYKNDAATELAQDAFHAAFEYSINWIIDDIFEIAKYYIENKNKLRRLGFNISDFKFKNSSDISAPNSNDLNYDSFMDHVISSSIEDSEKFRLESDNLDNGSSVMAMLFKQILPEDDMNLLYMISHGKVKISEENQDQYKKILDKISSNKKIILFCKEHNTEPEFIARTAFMLIRNI